MGLSTLISEYFTDEELISQLRLCIGEEIDYHALLGQVEEVDENTFQIRYGTRVFQFDRILCGVTEVNK